MLVEASWLELPCLSQGARHVRIDLCDVANGLGPSLPEDHPGVGLEVLGVLDESEAAGSLVPRPEVLLVHGDDGGSLASAATVDWGGVGVGHVLQ